MKRLAKWVSSKLNPDKTSDIVPQDMETAEQLEVKGAYLISVSDPNMMDSLPNEIPQLSFSFNFGDKHA